MNLPSHTPTRFTSHTPVLLIVLVLLLNACGSAATSPTTAPETSTLPPATAFVSPVAGTPVSLPGTPTPSPAVVATQTTAEIGSPVFATVLPAGTGVISGTPGPGGTPALPEAPTPIPTLPGALGPTTLKYHVLGAFPDFFYCDPDSYPVGRDEAAQAKLYFPEIQANAEEYQAILAFNHLDGVASLSADQKLLVYREHKKLAALRFELAGQEYQFQLQTKDSSGKGLLITGRINGAAGITAQQSQPAVVTCPICLAAQTRIDTPRGPVRVPDLRPGDLVWTVDAAGARVAAPILATTRVPVPASHQMVHLKLDDGRELWASPGHPTADGRRLGDLAAGDQLDGARVTLAERVTYGQPATYDLLPASATGFYWADGILIGSTLK